MAQSKIVEAVGRTSLDGERGKRGRLLAEAMNQSTADYLREVAEYNQSLEPADYVDEAGQTITGFVDPKRMKTVDTDEILKRRVAARVAAKKAMEG